MVFVDILNIAGSASLANLIPSLGGLKDCDKLKSGWPLFWKTWKSQGIFSVRDNRKSHWKVREIHTVSIHYKFEFYLQKHAECSYMHRGFPPLLGDGHLPRPHPSHCFAARPQRYASRLRVQYTISFVHSQPYWKSQGKVREFHLAWRVVNHVKLVTICHHILDPFSFCKF